MKNNPQDFDERELGTGETELELDATQLGLGETQLEPDETELGIGETELGFRETELGLHETDQEHTWLQSPEAPAEKHYDADLAINLPNHFSKLPSPKIQ